MLKVAYYLGDSRAHATIFCPSSILLTQAKIAQATQKKSKNKFQHLTDLNRVKPTGNFQILSKMCHYLGLKRFKTRKADK